MNRLTVFAFVILLPVSAVMGSPMVVTCQGSPPTSTGAPVRDGTYEMQFTLFHPETTGIASGHKSKT